MYCDLKAAIQKDRMITLTPCGRITNLSVLCLILAID